MKVVETGFGVANTYKTDSGYMVEVNSKLKEFPELMNKILEHERQHTKTKGFWKNRKLETNSNVKFRELIPFFIKYPRHFFQQYSPVTYRNNTLYFEWSLIFLYLIYVGIGFFIMWMINLFSDDWIFFWRVIKYMVIISGITIGLYIIGKKLKDSINEEASRLTSKKKKTDKQKLENLSAGL